MQGKPCTQLHLAPGLTRMIGSCRDRSPSDSNPEIRFNGKTH